MFKPSSSYSFFVPGTNVGQVKVAEDDPADAGALKTVEHSFESYLVVVRMRGGLHERDPD